MICTIYPEINKEGLVTLSCQIEGNNQTKYFDPHKMTELLDYLDDFDVLVDLQGLQKSISTEYVLKIIEQLRSATSIEQRRWAFVATDELNFGMTRMMASLAGHQDIEVHVFKERDSASDWLNNNKQNQKH